MPRRHQIAFPIAASIAVSFLAGAALAQDIGNSNGSSSSGPSGASAAAPGGGATAPGSQGNTVMTTPPTQTTTTTYSAIGLPAPGTDLDAHLPSSSRAVTDTSRSTDNFDLVPGTGEGAAVHGSNDGPAILKKQGSNVPSVHLVRPGDTLWSLCNSYFQNPWAWPKIWSYNPQIQNPHWIYPGDQVRLRIDNAPERPGSIVIGHGQGPNAMARSVGGFTNRRSLVPRGSIFLRDQGYIDDPKKDVWGELVGAEEEQMLLTEGDNVYAIMRPGADLRIGELLTVFRSIRTPKSIPGARRPPGEIVSFKGTIKVDDWNPKTRVARGRLIESLDTVERGDKVGPVTRRFEVVPPRPSDVDVEARVLTSIYPHEILGQNQIAFIDRGSKDGLAPGNRLLLVRRGDSWRRTLKTTTKMARTQVLLDVPEHVQTVVTPLVGKAEDFPEEVFGELRVVRADEYSSVTIVTSSKVEIEPGDRAVSRKGY